MNIYIYGLNYTPEVTGTGKYTGELASWLASHNNVVKSIAGLPHYPQWCLDGEYADGRSRSEIIDGVLVDRASHYVPSKNRLGAVSRILLETTFTLSASRYWIPVLLHRNKPNIVIAVTPPLQIGVWPILGWWLRRVPWVLHVQDLQVDAALRLGILKLGVFGKFLYWMERFLLRHATRVSTITETMRQRIIEKGVPADRVWLCPNWADISTVRPTKRETDFRRALHLSADAIVVLYAGNMGEKQGLQMVLDVAHLLQSDQRLHFIMVGDGAAKARLQRRAVELGLTNVRFLPLQPMEGLNDMLAAGDIHLVVQKRSAADLVMPSKLTNILAAGRCCIATADADTALHEVIQGHDIGLVTPPEDVAALAGAIEQLAIDSDKRACCGVNARKYAEQYLDKDVILSGFETKLKTLCE